MARVTTTAPYNVRCSYSVLWKQLVKYKNVRKDMLSHSITVVISLHIFQCCLFDGYI